MGFLAWGKGSMGMGSAIGGLMQGIGYFSFLAVVASSFFCPFCPKTKTDSWLPSPMPFFCLPLARLLVLGLRTSQLTLATLISGEVLSFSILGMRSSWSCWCRLLSLDD
jgi:hypothetical protein